MRLAARFLWTMTAVVTLLAVAISCYLIREEKRKLVAEMEQKALILAETISLGINSATFLERKDLLVDYFDHLVAESNGQILYTLVTRRDGFAWIDTLRKHEYEILNDPITQKTVRALSTLKQVVNRYRHPDLDEEVIEAATPIVGGMREQGILRIGFSLKPLRAQIQRAVANSVGVGVVALGVGVVLSLYFARGVARPIGEIVHFAREVSEGQLKATISRKSKPREIEEMARSIGKMKRDLKYLYVGGLFSDLSHSLKSDLGFLYSEVERLRGEGKEVRGLLDRLDRITREIQKFKTLQKPADLKKVKLEVLPFLNGVTEQLTPEERRRLEEEISTDLPAILGDSIYLGRALGQILKNAHEAVQARAEASKVKLNVSQNNGQLLIEVVDRGTGIAPENLPHLFEPRFSTKRGQGGEGLGLAFAQMIIEDIHEGEIQIESRLGEGTKVKILLPFCT